ncbi:MAG: alpha/beta fold hydrolase [Pseudomonadota bacterium]|nr:alpha/beta fold hydrolase [Pseudomonadota bacterium]
MFKRPGPPLRRQRLETFDGDFVDLDWLDATDRQANEAPVVVLFHGLEGNSSSHYARALMRHLKSIGWRGVIPHFRGCSGEPNQLPRAYHSGDHVEIGWMLSAIRVLVPSAALYAVGVSLGGSALLNWLGREERRAASQIDAAAAVSAPLDLTAAGVAIGQGFNRVYTRHFLQTLIPKALEMARRFPGTLDELSIRRADSMYAFDDVVTAPLHGFDGADDYWSRASSKPWLRRIAVPTLVLNARNDPFIPAASLPTAAEVSAAVTLEQPDTGGHVGFLSAPFPGSLDWLPLRLVQFFASAQDHPATSSTSEAR